MSRRQSWPTKDGVTTTSSVAFAVELDCHEPGCPVEDVDDGDRGRNRIGIAARRHVARTGHRVRVATTRVVDYLPDE